MTTDTHAIENAQAWLENIVEMVKRLEHADEGTCNSSPANPCLLWERSDIDTWDDYHDADAAREAIEESPLSVEVRSGWYTPASENATEAVEYKILLTWGGPACRIIGELDQYGEPETARLEWQDWGTPWTEYQMLLSLTYSHPESDMSQIHDLRAALLTYARQFYYGG